MNFYTHYYFRSNNTTGWVQQEFTQFQGENYGFVMFHNGYAEDEAQRLIDWWNRCGRRMPASGYEYTLKIPLTFSQDSVEWNSSGP